MGKIVDMLFAKGILSPAGNSKWTRAAVDKLLTNKKYVPIVGMEVYLVLLADDILSYDITLREYDGKENDLKDKAALERDTRRKKLKTVCKGVFAHFSTSGASAIFDAWDETNAYLSGPDRFDQTNCEQKQEEYFRAFTFCFGVLPALEKALKEALKKELRDDAFPIAFQSFGNNIRAIGSAANISEKNKDKINAENLFALPSRVNRFIKLLRKYPLEERSAGSVQERRASVYVVINNFKNIFEAYYFKRRYSAFYLLAVACDESMRREKFADRMRIKAVLASRSSQARFSRMSSKNYGSETIWRD